MKLINVEKERYRFQLNRREQRLFLNVLKRYPFVPSGHFKISKSGELAENQALLDEALAEQRTEHARQLHTLLHDESPFGENDSGYSLTLKASQIDWLLQVLNDIRVGAWVALGSPDHPAKMLEELLGSPDAAANTQNALKILPDFHAMEVAGHFQSEFLAALNHDSAAPAEE